MSAEIRWFWHRLPPPGWEHWFREASVHCFAVGGGEVRTDTYLRDPAQTELGLKRRGEKSGTEVKGLVVACWGRVEIKPFIGPLELWTKWTSNSLNLDPSLTVSTKKLRWLRKFDTASSSPQEIKIGSDEKPADGKPLPSLGCNVELTQVTLPDGEIWWTLGFESFGSVDSVASSLLATAAVLAARQPPAVEPGVLASYPAWLQQRILEL